MKYLITVICEYIGHGKPISPRKLDEVLLKAIKLNCPNEILPLIQFHKRFLYFPREEIITNLIKFYYEKNDYKNFKEIAICCFHNQ
jgi:hypothetical protein